VLVSLCCSVKVKTFMLSTNRSEIPGLHPGDLRNKLTMGRSSSRSDPRSPGRSRSRGSPEFRRPQELSRDSRNGRVGRESSDHREDSQRRHHEDRDRDRSRSSTSDRRRSKSWEREKSRSIRSSTSERERVRAREESASGSRSDSKKAKLNVDKSDVNNEVAELLSKIRKQPKAKKKKSRHRHRQSSEDEDEEHLPKTKKSNLAQKVKPHVIKSEPLGVPEISSDRNMNIQYREDNSSTEKSSVGSSAPYFKPRVEPESKPVLGHEFCRICKSYYPDTEEQKAQHLSHHADLVFLAALPQDTYLFDIEEVICHFAKFGIKKADLQNKIKSNNLLKWPKNLKGFSCSKCEILDTSSEKEFRDHMKACGVTNKEEKSLYLVCFCRRCHQRCGSKTELEKHIMQGDCWPSQMTINRLYDSVSIGSANPSNKTAIEVKKEMFDQANLIRLKQEQAGPEARTGPVQQWVQPAQPRIPSRPSAAEMFNGYDSPPDYPTLGLLTPDPTSSTLTFNLTLPPPPATAPWLPGTEQSIKSEHIPGGPQFSENPRLPVRGFEIPRGDDLSFPFSPPASQSLSLQQPRAKSASVTQSVVSQDDGIEAVFSLPSAKLPSSEACNRSTCQWPDPHTENCAKQAIVRRCEAGLCVMEDNHRCFPNCTKLSFYVNCKKVADGMYKYFDATVKKIPTVMPQCQQDKSFVEEPTQIIMRLLGRKFSKANRDPRRAIESYPTSAMYGFPASSFRRKKNSKGWKEGSLICTWSGIHLVRVNEQENPHVCPSDPDSDIEVIDNDIV